MYLKVATGSLLAGGLLNQLMSNYVMLKLYL